MMNPLKTTLIVSALLCLTALPASAEEIIWKQPSSMQGYYQNLHFEGNATLSKADVRKLQKSLARKGFYKGRIDGIWGGRTTQAVLDYQAVHQQAQTGTVTIRTLRDLGVHLDTERHREGRRYRDESGYGDQDRYDRHDRHNEYRR